MRRDAKTEVKVPASWVAGGHLPPLCARHGVPATKTLKERFHTPAPLWLIVLAILSLLIGVLIYLAIRKTVQAQLPGCQTCTVERRKSVLTIVGIWVAVVLLFMGAMLDDSGALLLLWLAAVVAALVWSFRGGPKVKGLVSSDGQWVTLKGIDPGFASTVTQGLQQQYAAVRPATSFD